MNTLPALSPPRALRPMPMPLPALRTSKVRRLWLPLTPVFLLLSPLALLTLPIVALFLVPHRIDPLDALIGVGEVLLSLGGASVDVDTPAVLVRIRII